MRYLKSIVVIWVTLSWQLVSYGQKLLTKQEIYESWTNSGAASMGCDSDIAMLSPDEAIRSQFAKIVTGLKAKKVDTLLVLINAHPGLYIRDSCQASHYPAEIYIFWKYQGMEFVQKVPDKCGLNGGQIQSGMAFKFFANRREQITKQYLLPTILSARMKGTRIIYNRIITADQDEYLFYYHIGANCGEFSFSVGDITNRKNLFYRDNRESAIYRWFVILEGICKQF